ncbi:hypothetical protein [Streptomyces sp. NBC_00328]|uniref:hypothetical protein n=1 Tax=Streptomyces sp. NBC_00328 TaxID=2903646 RepID=UPI002E292D57|nr:hypothetical protein [Streptomyces sp. NBC_00328]
MPFGDLSGDRCNDVLVRFSSGSPRAYRPACGVAATPSTAYTSLGTGWNQYDVLTSPGDVSGDGRADLVSRDTAGTVRRNDGTGKGSFGGRTKAATGRQGYKGLF